MQSETNTSNTIFSDLPDIASRKQGAEALGVSEKYFGELLARGAISAWKEGNRWKVPKTSLIDYVARQTGR